MLPQRVVGIIRIIDTLWRNFEFFGEHISLDMMKRGLNTLLWPYVAIAMYDKMQKLCIAFKESCMEDRLTCTSL